MNKKPLLKETRTLPRDMAAEIKELCPGVTTMTHASGDVTVTATHEEWDKYSKWSKSESKD